jgi:di/tricarboxylate transporter
LVKRLLKNNKSYGSDLFRLLFPLTGLSAFINNIPLVIMLTPIIRKWAVLGNKSPSKYLIPLSFATILGGTCCLIGTSTNLVVSYFLEDFAPGSGFSFFTVGKVGFFCALFGLLYLVIFSHRFLPERIDPQLAISGLMHEVLGEFEVLKTSIANLTVREISKKYLSNSVAIIALERGGEQVLSPSPDFKVLAKDRLVFCGDHKEIEKLYSLKGLASVADPRFHIENAPSHYSELVVPVDSILVGKTLKQAQFRDRFGGSVFALFRGGKPLFSNISTIPLKGGDVLIVISAKPRDEHEMPKSKDLFFISQNGQLSYLSKKKSFFVYGVILAFIGLAIYGFSIAHLASAAAIVLLIANTVSPRDVLQRINWNLLILIIGGLALAKSVEVTGVAHLFAEGLILTVGSYPHLLIFTIFIITVIFTELVTNVASALIILPIALSIVDLSSPFALQQIQGIGVTVAIGASCSFLTPIGYQTNTIIYGPGGYRFSDYFRVGFFLSLLVAIFVTCLVPYFWQMS